MSHPLDRAVWTALTTRQADLSLGDARARRFAPEYGLFAAAVDASDESVEALAALVRTRGEAAFFEADPPAELPGVAITPGDPISQFVAEAPTYAPAEFEVVTLGDADAAEMLDLATLTRPGPFFSRTHRLGDFVGVRVGGRLAVYGRRAPAPARVHRGERGLHPSRLPRPATPRG